VLSPKARNLVRDSWGAGAATFTLNVHDRVVGAASVAEHCTTVVPTGNCDPDAREQLTCTGAMPPVVFGAPKVTVTGLPLADAAL
jgi:hypothetical protein